MSVQTKLIQATRQDEVGYEISGNRYYDHIITIEGVDHHYHSKSKDLTAFIAGKEASYTVEEKTNKRGQTQLKVSPFREPPKFTKPPFTGGGGKSSYSKDDAQITLLSCISSAANFHQGRSTQSFQTVIDDALKAYEVVRSKRGDFN